MSCLLALPAWPDPAVLPAPRRSIRREVSSQGISHGLDWVAGLSVGITRSCREGGQSRNGSLDVRRLAIGRVGNGGVLRSRTRMAVQQGKVDDE